MMLRGDVGACYVSHQIEYGAVSEMSLGHISTPELSGRS
jgi:hypothetical protein